MLRGRPVPVRDPVRGNRSPSLESPCFAAMMNAVGLYGRRALATFAPSLGGLGSSLCSSREGPRRSRSLWFSVGAVDAASELRLDGGPAAVISIEDRLEDILEKLGRRILPFTETAIFAKLDVVKKSGTIVAISGPNGGMLPVIIHSPVSATDQP